MCCSTESVSRALPAKRASSTLRSETEPATSAATIGGSARTTGICETPYSCRIATASAMVSPGWVCTRSGSRPDLPRSTSPTVWTVGSWPLAKPYWPSHSSLNTLVR